MRHVMIFLTLFLTLSHSICAEEDHSRLEEILKKPVEDSYRYDPYDLFAPRQDLIITTKEGKVIDLNYYPEYSEDIYRESEDAYDRYRPVAIYNEQTNKEYYIPLDLRKSDLVKLAVGSGLIMIAFKNDEQIKAFAQENKTPVTEDIATIGQMLGNGGYMTPAMGLTYVVGAVIKDDKLKRLAVMAVKTELMTGILAQALKMTFHRERPNESDSSTNFHGPDYTNLDYRSFPSGHTTTAFSLATVIADTYSDSKIIPVLAYGAAAIAGASRVHDNAHWASDVIAGALVGHIATKIILRNEKNSRRGKKRGIIITPSYVNGAFGFSLRYKF